jgi:hypothetical protein
MPGSRLKGRTLRVINKQASGVHLFLGVRFMSSIFLFISVFAWSREDAAGSAVVTRSVTVVPMRAEVRTSVLAALRWSGIHA